MNSMSRASQPVPHEQDARDTHIMGGDAHATVQKPETCPAQLSFAAP
jgi:hypothetical protein